MDASVSSFSFFSLAWYCSIAEGETPSVTLVGCFSLQPASDETVLARNKLSSMYRFNGSSLGSCVEEDDTGARRPSA